MNETASVGHMLGFGFHSELSGFCLLGAEIWERQMLSDRLCICLVPFYSHKNLCQNAILVIFLSKASSVNYFRHLTLLPHHCLSWVKWNIKKACIPSLLPQIVIAPAWKKCLRIEACDQMMYGVWRSCRSPSSEVISSQLIQGWETWMGRQERNETCQCLSYTKDRWTAVPQQCDWQGSTEDCRDFTAPWSILLLLSPWEGCGWKSVTCGFLLCRTKDILANDASVFSQQELLALSGVFPAVLLDAIAHSPTCDQALLSWGSSSEGQGWPVLMETRFSHVVELADPLFIQ